MEFKVVNEERNAITLEVIDPNENLLQPLVNELLKVSEVTEARFQTGHPYLDKPVLYIRTKKVKPQTTLKKVADSLAEQYSAAKKLLEKELK